MGPPSQGLRTLFIFLCLALYISAVSATTIPKGLWFESGPTSWLNRTISAPSLNCLRMAPDSAKGYLISYEAIRSILLTAEAIESTLRALAPRAVLLITTTNVVDGNLAPFLNDTKRNDFVAGLIRSWGIQGVIQRNTISRDPGQAQFAFNQREWCGTINMTWVEVGYYQGLELEKLSLTNVADMVAFATNRSYVTEAMAFVHITAGDKNVWNDLRQSGFMIFWRVSLALISGVSAIIALYKLLGFIKLQGVKPSVAQLTLFIVLIGSLYRCPYVSIDPIYQRYADTLGYQAHMMVSIHFPINVLTTLLLALYWKDTMDSSSAATSGFLSKMKIPFLVLAIIIVGMEILISSLRAAERGNLGPAIVIYGAMYIIIMGGASVFFLIMGGRIIARLKRSVDAAVDAGDPKSMMRRTTRFVIASGALNIVFLSSLVQAVFNDWFWTATGFIVVWSTCYYGLFIGTLLQVLTVRVPTAGEFAHAMAVVVPAAVKYEPTGPRVAFRSVVDSSMANTVVVYDSDVNESMSL